MNLLRKAMDDWFGRGEASITVPPLDGAFRPNDLLDAATTVLEIPEPDCLAQTSQGLIVSSGRSLFNVHRPDGSPLATFDSEISALTGLPDGGAAVGLIDGKIAFVGGQNDGKTIARATDIRCITALAPSRDGALLVANGSASNQPSAYKRDLLEKNASGSIWLLEPQSGARRQVAGSLAYPYGLLEEADSVVVSESWRSALTRISLGGGRSAPVLENLPAYPSRLTRSANNTIWLALFAPRSQLVEFVLSETRYRRRMLDEIDPDYWIAPCLRAGHAPQEPTQQGGVRQQGVMKPWAPTRSYGLAVQLDPDYRPVASLHSRANGRRHGVTSCLEIEGRLFFCSKGNELVASCATEGLTS